MGHLYIEALSHLPQQAIGCEITTPELGCIYEVCRLAKAHEIVSRRPIERGRYPYYRITGNWIYIEEGDKDKSKIFHFYCDVCQMNYVFLLSNLK